MRKSARQARHWFRTAVRGGRRFEEKSVARYGEVYRWWRVRADREIESSVRQAPAAPATRS